MNALRVLIIEDNPADASLMGVLLRSRRPAEIRVVETLAEALAIVCSATGPRPDVMLADLFLPDSEGIETVRSLVRCAPDVAIVALSGGSDETMGLEAVRAGAQDYLLKGRMDADALARAVRHALERHKANQALKRRAEHEQLIRRSAGLTWWEWDLASDECRHSEDWAATFGMPEVDAFRTAREFFEIVDPEDVPGLRAAMEPALRTGAQVEHDFRFVRSDGSRVWASVMLRGRLRDGGEVTHLFGVTRNVDLAKRREVALGRLAEIAPVGEGFFGDLAGHLATALGVRWAMIAERQGEMMRVLAMWDRGVVTRGLEYPLKGTPCDDAVRCPDGCLVPTGAAAQFPEDESLRVMGVDSYMGAAMHTARGELLGVVSVMHDGALPADAAQLRVLVHVYAARAGAEIARLRAEASLRAREEADAQSRRLEAIGRLASGVAHDITSLTAAIRGYASLALSTLPPGHPARESLARVEEAARHASGMTSALLTFAKGAATRKARVRLGPLVEAAGGLFSRMAPQSVHLDMDVSGAADVWVDVNEAQVQQVILNLLDNAADASGGAGRVRLEAGRRAGGEAFVRVEDWGVGMTPEVKSRVFEPFFTTKPEGQGTGLGLPMAHGVVAEHGGRLEIESEAGRGTRVTVVLPAREAPSGREAVRATPGDGSRRALVVERDVLVRGLLASMLETLGYEVTAVGEPAECAASMEAGRPELIVSGSGPEAWGGRSAMGDPRKVRWVFVTGNGHADVPRGDGVAQVRTPFGLADLREAIEATQDAERTHG